MEKKRVVRERQGLGSLGKGHGPEQAGFRLHLGKGYAVRHPDSMQGALGPAAGLIGEQAETVLGRVDGIEAGLHVLKHIVVSVGPSQMGAELRRRGHDPDDPAHFRRSNADLVGRTAAGFT